MPQNDQIRKTNSKRKRNEATDDSDGGGIPKQGWSSSTMSLVEGVSNVPGSLCHFTNSEQGI